MPDDALRPEQREIVRLFFSMPDSHGFVLVGGAALVALGLTDRPTEDVDFFTSDAARISHAVAAFTDATTNEGWSVELGRGSATFQRIFLTRRDTHLSVDIAHDTAALRPLVESDLGPTFDPLEHAARKALAVFDRAEARDFVDLYRLSTLFTKAEILALAQELDLGFDERVFGQSLRSISRFRDNALPCEPADASIVRSFANDWANELDHGVRHRPRTT